MLLVISILTPAQLALGKQRFKSIEQSDEDYKTDQAGNIVNSFIDVCFLIDVFICFFSAIENEYNEVIDDRKLIAIGYLKGWFTIDVASIFPFDAFSPEESTGADFNQFLRLAKFGRLYKLIKLTKLIRLIRIVKNQKILMGYIQSVFRVSVGIKRLLFFCLIFFILCHITACMFILVADFENSESFEGTWLQNMVGET